jgi:cytochrome P450
MRGFELLKEHTNGAGLFEIWFDSLLSTLDGHSHTERKKLGAKGLSQKQRVDYTVS